MELSDRIKDLRIKQGLSQKDMADRLGVALSTYQYYERGERNPPSDFLTQIITTFGVSPAWLLTGREPEKPQGVAEEQAAYGDIEIIEIITLLRSLPEDKTDILNLLRARKSVKDTLKKLGGMG